MPTAHTPHDGLLGRAARAAARSRRSFLCAVQVQRCSAAPACRMQSALQHATWKGGSGRGAAGGRGARRVWTRRLRLCAAAWRAAAGAISSPRPARRASRSVLAAQPPHEERRRCVRGVRRRREGRGSSTRAVPRSRRRHGGGCGHAAAASRAAARRETQAQAAQARGEERPAMEAQQDAGDGAAAMRAPGCAAPGHRSRGRAWSVVRRSSCACLS